MTFKQIYRLHGTDVLAASGPGLKTQSGIVERFFAGQLINYVFLLRLSSFVCLTISTVGTLRKTQRVLRSNFNKGLTWLHLSMSF